MSIKVMTYVWDGFPAAGSELLAMLALADWCDDRGGSLYPSVKAVGDKVRVKENHARKILRKFEQDRFLAVVGNHNGGKPGTTREYRLNVGRLKMLADEENAKREAERLAKYGASKRPSGGWDDVFETAIPQDTPIPQDGPTATLQHRQGHPAAPTGPSCSTETAPLQGGLSTKEPPEEPPGEPPITAGADDGFVQPPMTGAVCMVMKACGMQGVNPSHPDLKILIDSGADIGLFVEAAKKCVEGKKPFNYALTIVKNQMKAAAAMAETALATPAYKTAPAQRQPAESFAEREERMKRHKWEEMTGQKWPTESAPAQSQHGYTIDAETRRIA